MNGWKHSTLLRRRAVLTSVTAIVFALSCSGCVVEGSTGRQEATGSYQRFDEVWDTQSEFRLEEHDDVINVWPTVRPDIPDGFLVADWRDTQFRSYDDRGALRSAFGGPGGGPAEFSTTRVAIRLRDGTILALDSNTKGAIFDSAGRNVLKTFTTELNRVDDADVLNDSLVLIAARATFPNSNRLHIWNLRAERISTGFFNPITGMPHEDVAQLAGWTQAAVLGDTVAVTFAVSDTVYYFTRQGIPIGKIRIPFIDFRYPTGRPETVQRGDPKARNEWMASFDLVAAVYWTSDGDLVIPYQTFDQGQPVWHLMGMSPDGDRRFDIRNTTRLLTSDAAGSRFYFVAPGAVAQNRWLVTQLAPPGGL